MENLNPRNILWPITDKESQRSLCTFLVCKRRKLRSADWWTQSVSEALTLKDRIKNKRKSYSIFSLEVQLLTLCLETRLLKIGTTWVFWMHSVTCFDTSEKLKTKLPVHCTCLCFFLLQQLFLPWSHLIFPSPFLCYENVHQPRRRGQWGKIWAIQEQLQTLVFQEIDSSHSKSLIGIFEIFQN